MKTIALSMIFSLAVIVCEGQTLFAPHFVTFDFQAPNSTNSLVPIAGVNRSVPLAGASYNPGKGASYNPGKGASRSIIHPQFSPSGPDRKPKNDVWVVDTGDGLTSVESLSQASRNSSDALNGPGMHDSVHDIRGEDDGPLVWDAPRGYFGLGGSAERIAGEAKDTGHKDW